MITRTPIDVFRVRMVPGRLVPVLAMLFVSSAVRIEAGDARWVRTHFWKGNGTRQTQIFPVFGRRWRVRYKYPGKGLLQISVYNAEGKLIDAASARRDALPGLHTVRTGPGRYFLAINGIDGDWEVTLEQYLTLIERWRLREEMKKPAPPLHKYAVWTGQDVDADYPVHIPTGSWKVVFTNEGSGVLQVIVRRPSRLPDQDRTFVALAANTDTPGTGESWVHASGDFVLHITAMRTKWKVEVYGTAPPPAAAAPPMTKP